MNNKLRNFFIAAVALFLCSGNFTYATTQEETTELIIRFKQGYAPHRAWQGHYGVQATQRIIPTTLLPTQSTHRRQRLAARRLQRTHVITVPTAAIEETIADLSADPRIALIEPNTLFHASTYPLDTHFDLQWYLDNDGSLGTEDADIDAPEAWSLNHDSTIAIGIMDSGIDTTHEDLAENIWVNPGEIASDGIDNDGNGYIDDINGWDFVNNDNDPFDDNGHGTQVAGVAGAVSHNNTGIAGMVWDANLVALKVLDENGDGNVSDIVDGLLYMEAMDIPISNNSYNSSVESETLSDAITVLEQNDHLFIASAGNDGDNSDDTPSYPASFTHDNIISVTATTYNDVLSGFSNTGLTSVDIAAPGSSIYTTVPTGGCAECDPSGYAYASGTSLAAPLVAGMAALMWEEQSTLTTDQIKTALLESGDPLDALTETTVSGKRLNAYQAMIDAQNNPPNAAFSINDNDVFENTTVVFNASTSTDSDDDTLTYTWDFGDGSTSSGTQVSHRFTAAGIYTITLTAHDGTWTDTVQHTVTVREREYSIARVYWQRKKVMWNATVGMENFRVKLRFRGRNGMRTIHRWGRGENHFIRERKIKRFLHHHPRYQQRKKLRIKIIGFTPDNEIQRSTALRIPKRRFTRWRENGM